MIEEESQPILQLEQIKDLIDVEKLAVFGPRRSVGMLRFVQRPDETSLQQVKDRMWKVVRAIAALKHVLQSTKASGDDKVMWAAFMKTKAARQRTAHISMVRRVTITLASDSKNEAGGVLNVEHTIAQSYDMDWSAGTIWCGIHKLASATHRAPKSSEVISMPGGWVNLDAVELVAGCTPEAAKAAFELSNVSLRPGMTFLILGKNCMPRAPDYNLRFVLIASAGHVRVKYIDGVVLFNGIWADKTSKNLMSPLLMLTLFLRKKFLGVTLDGKQSKLTASSGSPFVRRIFGEELQLGSPLTGSTVSLERLPLLGVSGFRFASVALVALWLGRSMLTLG